METKIKMIIALLLSGGFFFIVFYYREKIQAKYPRAFALSLGMTVLLCLAIVPYKYYENKTQAEGLKYLHRDNGEEMFNFSRLDRASGIVYSSGDILVGEDKKIRLKKDAVGSDVIDNKSIENEDISEGAIDSRTIANGSIDGLDIDSGADLNIKSILFGKNSITDGDFVGDWRFKSGGLVVDGDIDAKENVLNNIGDAGTDFTNTGGLNLAGDLSLTGKLKILEDGANPSHFTIFQGSNQSENITYNLPGLSADGLLKNDNGDLSWDTTEYQPVSEMGHVHSHAGIDYSYDVSANTVNPNKGTLNVPANSGTFYTDNTRSELVHVDLDAKPVLVLVDDVQNFIAADRETKTFVAFTDEDQIDFIRYLPYAEVFKRSGSNSIHMQLAPMLGNGELEMHHERVARTDRYARESGLDGISVNGALEITVSGGYIWSVNTRYYLPTSTTASRGFSNKHDLAGNWISTSTLNPKIDNVYYDNGTGLVELDDDYYAINYIYRGVENEDHVYMIYSNEEYSSLELAKAASNIGDLPEIVKTHAVLVGRVIVQKNKTADFVIESAYGEEKFNGTSVVTSHNSLNGLNTDSHLQYALLAGRAGGQNFLGKMGFGIENPQYALDVKAADNGVIARFQGNTNVAGCSVIDDGTISCTSDKSLKKNINEIGYGLSDILKLAPVEYNWKTDSDSKAKSLGFIAQDVENIIPKLVTTDLNGLKQLNTTGVMPVVVKAIQEQQTEIDTLKEALEKLQKKVEALEAK